MFLEFPVVSFLCAFLALIPLPWHWRAGTIATVSISLWLFLSNILNGVNAIIWADNIRIVAPVWCDIATKILIGANLALPASVFCLCVHLERVSSVREVGTSSPQRFRRRIFDALCCFILPLFYMALHYIVQGHRFDIIEGFGCRASIYVSLPAVFLVWVPPLLFCAGSMLLSALAFRNFWIRRLSFARHLSSSNSALTPSRYFRLMSMSLFQMFWGSGLTAFNMWFTLKGGLRPWTGWADVHFNFSRVGLFPIALIPPRIVTYTYILWWSTPVSTIIFFAFFGFGQDAVKEYRACFSWLKRKVCRLPHSPSKRSTGPFSLITFDKKSSLPRHVKIDVSINTSSTAHSATSPTTSSYTLHDKFADPPSIDSPLSLTYSVKEILSPRIQ